MTILEQINNVEGMVLLIFNHGLGDFCNFLPVFFELQKQTKTKLVIGSDSKRQLKEIYPNVVYVDSEIFDKNIYSFIYRVRYPEPCNSCLPVEHMTEMPKPYICASLEFGIPNFIWKPYRHMVERNKVIKRIGLHFFGHSSSLLKFCPQIIAEKIWQGIIEAGYMPFEVHMRPQFRLDYDCSANDIEKDVFPLATPENSLRFEEPNLKRLIEEIAKCEIFIGVDSGPLYLASAILGSDKVIGLENEKYIGAYFPTHINTISVKQYEKGKISTLLGRL